MSAERLNPGTGSRNWAKDFFEMAFPVCVMVLFLWCGCAPKTIDVERPARPWRCGRSADSAVEAGDWERALSLHEALIAKNPGNCLALYHRGYIHGMLGHHVEEIKDYRRSIDCGNHDDDQLYFNLGMAYVGIARLLDAADAFRRAVALAPNNPDNHFGLALALLELEKTDDAIAASHRVLTLDPNHVNGRMILVRALLDAGKLEETKAHLEFLHRLKPDDASVRELYRRYEQRRATMYD